MTYIDEQYSVNCIKLRLNPSVTIHDYGVGILTRGILLSIALVIILVVHFDFGPGKARTCVAYSSILLPSFGDASGLPVSSEPILGSFHASLKIAS